MHIATSCDAETKDFSRCIHESDQICRMGKGVISSKAVLVDLISVACGKRVHCVEHVCDY